MASLNKVFLIGNLTRDPELRYTTSGVPVANLRIAVNRRFRDKSGELKEDTCFVTVTAWDKQAEICNQYLQKGRQIFVEGRLQSRSWETSDGQKRSAIDVRAERIQFLNYPKNGGQDANAASSASAANAANAANAGASSPDANIEENASPNSDAIKPEDLAWDEE